MAKFCNKKKFMERASPYASPVTLLNYCIKVLWPNRISCIDKLKSENKELKSQLKDFGKEKKSE